MMVIKSVLSSGGCTSLGLSKRFPRDRVRFCPRDSFANLRRLIWLGLILLLTTVLDPSTASAAPNALEILDGGSRRVFEIANDEVLLFPNEGQAGPQSNPFVVIYSNVRQHVKALEENGTKVELVLYEKKCKRNDSSRRILTRRVLVQLNPEADPDLLAAAVERASAQRVQYAPGYLIFEVTGAEAVLEMTALLRQNPAVLSAEPILGKKLTTKALLNDPLLMKQWYLLNNGQNGGAAGIDLNLSEVWKRYRGRGVTIGIVDDGLQLTHPDLAANSNHSFHHDYRDDDTNPSPIGNDYHGTSVAGVAAASGNNSIGVAGVAYEATLTGIRLVGGIRQTDEQSSAAILHSNQVVHVSNNSWGAEDNGRNLDGPGPLMKIALQRAVRDGRAGKGTIFVWSGGNGGEVQDNVNYDGYANSIYVTAVAAVNDQGQQSSQSEPGACLIVAALSDMGENSGRQAITAVDLAGAAGLNTGREGDDLPDLDYTQYFGGSSAATAMVSGLVALMLEANSNLGWRDVQEILIRSATKIDPTDADWTTNAVGLHFNHKFGAGLANAGAAVRLATNWIHLGAQTNVFLEQTNLAEPIPDNTPAGIIRRFDFQAVPALRVEHVVLTATISHPRRGDLSLTLISPQGTRSRLAEKHSDPNPDYEAWQFMSVFHWGEHSSGIWKVQIADHQFDKAGTLASLRLELFGTSAAGTVVPSLKPLEFANDRLRLLLGGNPGYHYQIQVTTNLLEWRPLIQTSIMSGSTVEVIEPVAMRPGNRFFRAVQQLPLP